jgi:hypothetical protein
VITPKKCGYGQYLNPNNTINPNCTPCPEDAFCYANAITITEITANNSLAGYCPAGYKCKYGANHTAMNFQYKINPGAYLCKEGYYCEKTGSSTTEKMCPAGYYMPHYGAASSSECILCRIGYLCPIAGLAAPKSCDKGYYCPEEGMLGY